MYEGDGWSIHEWSRPNCILQVYNLLYQRSTNKCHRLEPFSINLMRLCSLRLTNSCLIFSYFQFLFQQFERNLSVQEVAAKAAPSMNISNSNYWWLLSLMLNRFVFAGNIGVVMFVLMHLCKIRNKKLIKN